MDHVFTHKSIGVALLAAFFAACGSDNATTAAVAPAASSDSVNPFENFNAATADTNAVDSIVDIIYSNPDLDTDILDSLLSDTTVSKQEVLDSIQSIVDTYISSSSMAQLLQSSSSVQIIPSSSTDIYSSSQVFYSSTIAESSSSIFVQSSSSMKIASSSSTVIVPTEPMPNNGVPYIRITMADSSALQNLDENQEPVYSECTIEIAGNGLYSDVGASGGKIRLRGNSTRKWYDKKPYRIKFNEKTEVLGLSANKDWVLLANFRDPTNYMNALVFDMARYMGTFDFVNSSRFVEVEINGDYKGLYQLTEQIEKAASRVNITDTGYLLALDQDDGPELASYNTNNFESSVYGMPVAVKYPKDPTSADLNTIKADFAKLEQAIADGNYETVNSLLDVNSYIDFLIIQELTRNVELEAPRSMFLHKDDESGKYKFGPVWDFDGGFGYEWNESTKQYFNEQSWILSSSNPSTSPYNCTTSNMDAWGNCNTTNSSQQGQGGYGDFNDFSNSYSNNYGFSSWDGNGETGFFTNLFANEQFLAAYKSRWSALASGMLSDVFAKLDTYASANATAMANDAARWPWPTENSSTGKDYTTAISKMKNWLNTRASNYTSIVNNY